MSHAGPLVWSSHAISHTGKVRKLNEDAYIERPEIGLWAVADGMGGHAAGDVASRTVVEALARVAPPRSLRATVDDMEDQLLAANARLRELAHGYDDDRTIGSTVVSLLVYRQLGIVMWAGDSRAYLQRQGALTQLTRDHSEVGELVRRGVILAEDAEAHPSANVITRAIGAGDELFVDIDAEGLQPGDTLLLCSDGLYRHLTDAEICEHLARQDPETICRQLIALTLERGAQDNVTVLVVSLQAPAEGHDG